ncbi:MAG: type II toxin-antitoxin system RelE/ParE family toxin [Chloroflexi bacterium]|nr:type II toxin-antitoxin system RelE/ParE family toxin [Chloroflexota bacterium]MBU1661564.1 type II toxin-antitoxin system RelE/ParE family toxin [Chloroflexota bacterium]
MYNLFIRRSAERDLRKLTRPTLLRVHKRILSLRKNPRPAGVRKLMIDLEGWRIRVGDYRILYQINDTAKKVSIVRVKHRRDVYR